MRAHEVSFLDLVQGEKQFQVPLYQRPYSWTEAQLLQLWRDMLGQAEGMLAADRRPGHFIGSIVLAPSPIMRAGGVQRWLVVDGQQRLTTLMIALTAIRDHTANESDGGADRVHRQYLVNEFREGDDHLRLLPTQADRSSYRSLVLKTPGVSSTGTIGEAYQFFRKAISAADDPEDLEDIARLEQVIRSGLSIVEITADLGDNVFRIFESLNNTGLKLSQADLLRNYLFMRLPSRGEDVYRDVWLPMQARLAPRELELLVWLDLVIRGDERVKQTEIYRVQQLRLEKLAPEDEAGIEKEIGELARRSRHLQQVLHPSRVEAPELRAALQRLSRWGAQTAYPLVMHLLDLLDQGVTDEGDVTEALSYVESFLVRRMVCQVSPNNLNRIFNAAPPQVGQDAPIAGAVRRYLSASRRYWPNDADIRRAARTRPFYWTGRGQQRFFVLRRLEESYDASEPIDFAKSKLTIEHVLPQTPTQEWLDLLANDVTDEASPKELCDLLVHTLGNLTLTAENARLSNSPFQRKQDIYQASALRMNREIADTPSWGKAQIIERADMLAKRMTSLWPAPIGDGGGASDGRDWSLLVRACAALPLGSWTTYGDLAELIGSHPVPVGVHLATQPVDQAWRVLMADGSISPGFRWENSNRTDDPRKVLESEGVKFVNGHAEPSQRITAADLAALLGMEAGEPPPAPAYDATIHSAAGTQFMQQLTEAHPEDAGSVLELLRYWQQFGGSLSFGNASETSCFLSLLEDAGSPEGTWPLAIYPPARQRGSGVPTYAPPTGFRRFNDA